MLDEAMFDYWEAYRASKQDPHIPLFPQAVALDVLNNEREIIRASTLQNWTNRGLLKLEENNPGRANRRLYSAADIMKIHVMVKLSALGVSASAASVISDDLAQYVDEVIKSEIDIHNAYSAGDFNAGIGKAAAAVIYEENGTMKVKFEKNMEDQFGSKLTRAALLAITSGLREGISNKIVDAAKNTHEAKVRGETENQFSEFLKVDAGPDYYIRISLSASWSFVFQGILQLASEQLKDDSPQDIKQ